MSVDSTDWLPLEISTGPEPRVEWCHFGKRRFTEPFFEQSVSAALRDPFSLLFRRSTGIDELTKSQSSRPSLEPRGFVFHMSRCGSTLVAQMLAALPEHIVLSEPPPIDAILRTREQGASEDQRIAWLCGWMRALGQPRNGENALFVKFDAWHVFDLPLIRRAFPTTPWIFLHRDPIEVLVSALRGPGLQFVGRTRDPSMSVVEARARVLADIVAAAIEHLPLGGRAIDYSRLPDALFEEIATSFSLDLDSASTERMRAVTAFHAKSPSLFFGPDGHDKRSDASAEARAWCERLLDPLHARLLAV